MPNPRDRGPARNLDTERLLPGAIYELRRATNPKWTPEQSARIARFAIARAEE
jgi:uncharacterized protein (DUF2384 family)